MHTNLKFNRGPKAALCLLVAGLLAGCYVGPAGPPGPPYYGDDVTVGLWGGYYGGGWHDHGHDHDFGRRGAFSRGAAGFHGHR